MTLSASVAEIQQAGVTVEPEEAVAIAQQLIATLRSGPPQHLDPPFGPPTVETVVLRQDGSVACLGCDATPAVSEIARLLQAMLPAGRSRIAGALRYTIARASLDVDAPPFDSVDDLSETLARFERGRRDLIVMRVLRRLDASRALVCTPLADRRRHPQATTLRHALREADARLYVQTLAPPAIIVAAPAESSRRSVTAMLACVAAGALLVAAGELMHEWHALTAAPAALPPIAAPAAFARPLPAIAPAASTAPADAPDATAALATASSARAVSVRQAPASARPRAKRATHVTRAQSGRSRGAPSRGVLDRLRLRWLRNMFARTDL